MGSLKNPEPRARCFGVMGELAHTGGALAAAKNGKSLATHTCAARAQAQNPGRIALWRGAYSGWHRRARRHSSGGRRLTLLHAARWARLP